jgi:hypothetical protein
MIARRVMISFCAGLFQREYKYTTPMVAVQVLFTKKAAFVEKMSAQILCIPYDGGCSMRQGSFAV